MHTVQSVSVDGHRLKLTNLDKVMYPETGTTKGEVIDYYARIAHVLVPYAADRPATRKRWVHGVGTDDAPGEMFFQKNLDAASTPPWIARRSIEHSSSTNTYPLVNDRATLVWLAQMAALEVHVPQWRWGPQGARRNPDRLVLDLDPGPGAGLREAAEVARLARAILREMRLDPHPVTSGSKGIHLYAALDGSQSSDTVSAVAHELARALEADHPDLVVSDMKKAKREGKVLVDWSQNNGNKTTIVPYSLRGRSHPTVAAPRSWAELEEPDLAQLDYEEVLRRVEDRGDLLAPLRDAAERAEPDRLTTYRSMRDPAKTPEPVPSARAAASSGMSFVVQEHHARRLHYDFRLEHDGVLVSWAVPKGMPTEPGRNHLAVQTEDHPIEYGGFAGDIPAGEYGAGHVEIWDSGTYELEKWREGEEVIVVVHGEKHGSHRYALIHTDDKQWLMHLMKDQPHRATGRASGRASEAGASSETEVDANPAMALRPELPRPMLATPGTEADVDLDERWAFEMKWDGIRAIAGVTHGTVRLVTRNGNDVSVAYPELADLLRAVEVDVVLDGEIVALDSGGRPDFGLLQQRMNLTDPKDVERARAGSRIAFMVFDILEKDGRGLLRSRWDERRSELERTVRSTGAVQVPPVFEGDLASAIAASRELRLEGVMAKRRDSVYLAGRRGRNWIKIKHTRTQEVVVAGWRPGRAGRSGRVGSLLLGVPDGDAIRYVGRVGSGFSERDLDDLTERLAPLARTTSAVTDVPPADARDARWVRAELVGEVEFSEWTRSRRLRHARWRGWRPEKSVDDIRIEG